MIAGLDIVEGHESDVVAWDAFVSRASGTYCHAFVWKRIVEKAYGLKTHYLSIRRDAEWVGILPLSVMPGMLPWSPRRAVSVPYCNYGGLLVADGADLVQVRDAALSFLMDKGISRLEVRDLCRPGDSSPSDQVTMILDLPDSTDALLKLIGGKARNQVRKAEREGLEIRWGREQASDFYAVYADNMGRLGTPVHARAFVDEILASFGDQADVLTVRLQGRAVATMLVLKFGDTWVNPIASSVARFRTLNANMLMYWEALRRATQAGAKRFDFGRSTRNSGPYKFKQQWGAAEIPLNYHSYLNGTQVSAASTDLYRGRKAAMFAKAWSMFPAAVQNRLGPRIRRYIP